MNHGKTMIGLVGGLLLVAGSVVFSGQALAADKIGVIDMRKIKTSSKAWQKVEEAAKLKEQSLQDGIKKDGDALVALQKDMEKKGSTWSDAVKKEKAAEFQKKRGELVAKQEKASGEMRKLVEEQGKPVQAKIIEISKKVAKDEGYTYVLPSEVLLIFPESADISDQVIEEVNKALK